MRNLRVALLGYGTVGKGVHKILIENKEYFAGRFGINIDLVAILVKNECKHKDLLSQNILVTTNMKEILGLKELDVVIEAIVGEEPAFSYVSQCLSNRWSVITANKELVAKRGTVLRELADDNNVKLFYEASVGGGIPLISTIKHSLKANQIMGIDAILNGTSNFILSNMEDTGCTFEEALTTAKQIGIAEADPSNDILGWDAFYKIMILSELIFNKQPNWCTSNRIGIDIIKHEDIQLAKNLGLRFKQCAKLWLTEEDIKVSVEPILFNEKHPFYSIEGTNNIISISSNLIGKMNLSGPGAGSLPTASAIIEDLLNIYNNNILDDNDYANGKLFQNNRIDSNLKEQHLLITSNKPLEVIKRTLGKYNIEILGYDCIYTNNEKYFGYIAAGLHFDNGIENEDLKLFRIEGEFLRKNKLLQNI